MARFDLELLLIFDEIYKTRNVTKAADNLGLPQSTVSIGLGKLRAAFDDQLFVRTARGMEPTPRAQNALAHVRQSVASLQSALAERPVFDPAGSDREFRICMTDISVVVLLPTLLNHLREVGPGIKLDVSSISPDSPADLEQGLVDLAVGFMPHLEAGFYQQKLFDQDFICLVATEHPRIGATLTREDLEREGHLVIRSSGTGHSIVDKVLAREGIRRNVVLHMPSFLGVAHIVSQTDYVAIVPHRYGAAMVGRENIRLLAPPVALPSFAVKQHWHERYHEDASNRWLRQVMAQLFSH
ncbi:LysR family transcriptional regulator [Duganella sp. LX20W]|uniref:LysR family transcriptional regulator n=1 Tax=Rugamonas brunnea TaxID=2758569 RepID=A0A7W2IBU8_9BURK|nr:LysR family transcriptional regulator [Rugamonas brunnea]MBA5637679.1 LysR family transcriptional regulator [Rugamonas brunnea]